MADEICMVVDFDGFRISGRFYVREMGFASLTRNLNESRLFDLQKVVPSLTKKDQYQVDFCRNHFHGLSLFPVKGEIPDYYFNLRWHIRYWYDQNRIPGKQIVGYKGGHIEKDLLNSMKIPCRNLEDFGCPKMNQLPEPEIQDCGWHVIHKPGMHCPLQETWAFAKWLRENAI